MTFEEFYKMRYYTATKVVVPLITKNNKTFFSKLKKKFINKKLRRKNKYDDALEKEWIESIYNKCKQNGII
jgi:hypothetical protein